MFKKWFVRNHGAGAENQSRIYRCASCSKLVTHALITRQGGCPCGSNRVSPTIPTWKEEVLLYIAPWVYK